MTVEQKKNIRAVCLYDGGKIESPLKILGREIKPRLSAAQHKQKLFELPKLTYCFQLFIDISYAITFSNVYSEMY
jgi:hypothetical protein